jgi:hypothetical protein
MKEATKIVVHGEQGLKLATQAFLLIDRRFHCLGQGAKTASSNEESCLANLHTCEQTQGLGHRQSFMNFFLN